MAAYINQFISIFKLLIVAGTTWRVIHNLMKCQTEGISLAEGIYKSKKVIKVGVLASLLPSLLPLINASYFTGMNDNVPYLNAKNLMLGMTNVLLLVEPALLTYKLLVEAIAYKVGSEDMRGEHKENIIKVTVAGVLIICATALVYKLLSYY